MNPALIEPNNGYEVEQFTVRWDYPTGHRAYDGRSNYTRSECEETAANPPRKGMAGTVVRRTVTASPWQESREAPGAQRPQEDPSGEAS